MRGLKVHKIWTVVAWNIVASFVDAWIESLVGCYSKRLKMVASFVDAWIESGRENVYEKARCVASFVDAWIERKSPALK